MAINTTFNFEHILLRELPRIGQRLSEARTSSFFVGFTVVPGSREMRLRAHTMTAYTGTVACHGAITSYGSLVASIGCIFVGLLGGAASFSFHLALRFSFRLALRIEIWNLADPHSTIA